MKYTTTFVISTTRDRSGTPSALMIADRLLTENINFDILIPPRGYWMPPSQGLAVFSLSITKLFNKKVQTMITDVIVKRTPHKGQGVFALRDFAQGEFIFRRRYSRVVANDEIESLSEEDQRHLCELDWETSAVLLSPGCYLNHACDPNAMHKGVKVFAWKDIRAGEEITIDYRLNAFDGGSWECVCGSQNCSGYVVNSFFALSQEQQRLYLPYTPTFIRQEYRRLKLLHQVE